MPAIGITGGISTGKTTFCDCLREIIPSAQFYNADQAARELTDSDPAVRQEIARVFGADIYSAGGDLNRKQLRARILQSAAEKRALEEILHPRIRRQWSAKAQTYRNSPDFFFADIPLLYETRGEALCDAVVVVACSPALQLARLRRRTPLAQAEAEGMIKAQLALEEKMKPASHVVWNNGDRDALAGQTRLLVAQWRS